MRGTTGLGFSFECRDASRRGRSFALVGTLLLSALAAGGCGPDATALASGLNDPIALTVVGNSLFWIENASSGHGLDASMSVIRTMPVAGGTPTTVLMQPHLDGNLASDGTHLYYSYTINSPNSVIASCGLDGSNVTTLSNAVQTNLGETASGETAMRVVSGTIYVAAQNIPMPSEPVIEHVYSLPTAGGTPAIADQLPRAPAAVSLVSDLYYADSSGVYFSYVETLLMDGSSAFHFAVMPLGGGAPTDLLTIAAAAASPTNNLPVPGSVTAVNGTVYFIGASPVSTPLFSIPASGGTPTMIANFEHQSASYLVGDANGLYINNEVSSNNPGIFSVTLSGSETSFYAEGHSLSTTAGHSRHFALDGQQVYWVTGGFNGGQGAIHARARGM